jgi:hypothetical protein
MIGSKIILKFEHRSMLLMLLLCIPDWDALVNGKLYYCTDGGTMDFILGPFGGGWVHYPESVPHVVPRPMDRPDEIKTGWSITGLWSLWGAFVGASVLVSALFAAALWRASSPTRWSTQQPPRRAADWFMQFGDHHCRPRPSPAAVRELHS